jgi:hypothetical protein
MKNVSVKFVSRLLTEEMKEHRVSAASDLIKCGEADSYFLNTITASLN